MDEIGSDLFKGLSSERKVESAFTVKKSGHPKTGYRKLKWDLE